MIEDAILSNRLASFNNILDRWDSNLRCRNPRSPVRAHHISPERGRRVLSGEDESGLVQKGERVYAGFGFYC